MHIYDEHWLLITLFASIELNYLSVRITKVFILLRKEKVFQCAVIVYLKFGLTKKYRKKGIGIFKISCN